MKNNNFNSYYGEFKSRVVATSFFQALDSMIEDDVNNESDFLLNIKGKALYDLMLLDPELKQDIESLPMEDKLLLENSLIVQDSETFKTATHAEFLKQVAKQAISSLQSHPEIQEKEGNGNVQYFTERFYNWGLTVSNQPSFTFVPKTKIGICNIVKWAKENNKKVRVAGYRHTWSDLFSNDNEVLISTLNLYTAQHLPAEHPSLDPTNELQGIEIVGTIIEDGVEKSLCKIGTGTTNEQFRSWCLSEEGGNYNWTLPLNVIMVEITFGGSNAAMCHGAGIKHKTLSDLVTEVEFVNAMGEIQTVSDPVLLKAAAGCLGMLGIVTSLTIKLDPMTYANMKPIKKRIGLTIPPPKGMSNINQIDMSGISESDKEEALREFISCCENKYYSEWFWFPYQPDCWINTWNNDGDEDNAFDYPTFQESKKQNRQQFIAGVLNDTVFKTFPKRQARFLGRLAMRYLPDGENITTYLIDALHFRRGIQNMRVKDFEMEIRIPPRTDDPTKPDWSVCQEAWWAVIKDFYERQDKGEISPMRLTLEMRIMGSSEMIISPQYGNNFGTCSIEVLTPNNVPNDEWNAYMQDIVTLWEQIKNPDGTNVIIRPHWAKQWKGLIMNNKPVERFMKEDAYVAQIPIFKSMLTQIASDPGGGLMPYTLQDCCNLFSNPKIEEIFEDIYI